MIKLTLCVHNLQIVLVWIYICSLIVGAVTYTEVRLGVLLYLLIHTPPFLQFFAFFDLYAPYIIALCLEASNHPPSSV
jgi:hypothetical protein